MKVDQNQVDFIKGFFDSAKRQPSINLISFISTLNLEKEGEFYALGYFVGEEIGIIFDESIKEIKIAS